MEKKCINCMEYAELGDGVGICLIKSTIKKLVVIKNPYAVNECNDFVSIDLIKNNTNLNKNNDKKIDLFDLD